MRHSIPAALATFALLAAPAAQAATPAGGTTFGGGYQPARGFPGDQQPFSVHGVGLLTGSGGRTVTLYLRAAPAKCAPATLVSPAVAVGKDGSFSGTAIQKSRGSGSATFKGRFIAANRAQGTASLTSVDESGGACKESFKWGVVAPTLKPTSGQAAKGATYGGSVSVRSAFVKLGIPILVRISSSGRQFVVSLSMGV